MIHLIENNLNVIIVEDAGDLALIHQEVFNKPWDKTVFDKFLKDPTFLGFKVLEQTDFFSNSLRVGDLKKDRSAEPECEQKYMMIRSSNRHANYRTKLILERNLIGFILFRKIVDEVEVITFAVKKAFQNQGIGKILLKTVIEHVSYNSIFLEVNTKNNTALHLYQKFHFKIQSLRRSYYENGEDAYLMCFTKSCDH